MRGNTDEGRESLGCSAAGRFLSGDIKTGFLRSDSSSHLWESAGGGVGWPLTPATSMLGFWGLVSISTAHSPPGPAEGGREAWSPRFALPELALSHSRRILAPCFAEGANDSGAWFSLSGTAGCTLFHSESIFTTPLWPYKLGPPTRVAFGHIWCLLGWD